MLGNLQFSTLIWIQFSDPFWQACRSVIWTLRPNDKFCTFFPPKTGLWVVGASSAAGGGDMWQGLGAPCPLMSPCLPGFPRALSDPGSLHWSCPALPLCELWDRVPSLWCPCPARCAMTHRCCLTSLKGPLALPAAWHMQPSRILARILSPIKIRCARLSTETHKIAEDAGSMKCLLLT